jgi:hypothetical protein
VIGMTNTRSTLGSHLEGLRGFLAEFDARDVPLPEVGDVFADVVRLENMVGALRLLLLRRVAESNLAKQAGQSTAEWVANRSGESVGKARADLETSGRLENLPLTDERLRNGDLSAAQTGAITDASTVNPNAEQDLIDLAERDSLKELRAEAERRKAEMDRDRDAARARAHRERSVRHWTNGETGFLMVKGPKARIADITAAIRPYIDHKFRRPGPAAEREPRQAYAFDALHQLCTTGESGQGSTSLRRQMLIRVDLTALVRGQLDEGEICEIDGIGPILVSEARDLLGDATLRLVLTNGVAVGNVVHLGRGPNVAQTIAKLWERASCIVEGCDNTVRIEYDHRTPWRTVHTTQLDNLDGDCKHCHDLITHHGYALVEGTGRRPLVAPTDPRHPNNKPPEPNQLFDTG